MAKKKSTPNKSDFVRAQPATMTASEVVAKAKEQGMTMTSALVYQVRAAANPGKGKGKRGPGRRSPDGKMSASEFIRSMPESMKAQAVAKKGASEGYTFKAGLVYQVRRAQKKNAGKVTRLGRPPKPGNVVISAQSSAQSRAAFRRLMVRIGLDQAEALYAEVHRELRTIEGR